MVTSHETGHEEAQAIGSGSALSEEGQMKREAAWKKIDFKQLAAQIQWDERGLVPTIVQDAISKEVLMLAYMNEQSLARSLETGETWFWSRSRNSLWHKGETSGNVQSIEHIYYDCDRDTLLVTVVPHGPACHKGTYSCFQSVAKENEESVDEKIAAANERGDRFAMLSHLERVIAQRDAERPEGAYTTYLFEKGVDKILKKVGEEAGEVIIAAKNRDPDELRWEVSDLIYHLLVLLREQRLSIDDVMMELKKRHAN